MGTGSENKSLLAAALVVLAMSILGLIDNFIRLIAEEAGLWQFHFLRAAIICSLVLLGGLVFKWELKPKSWKAVFARSLFFSTAMVLYFGAAGILPLAQVGAGMFTSPIFVLVISALFLGTKIGVWRVIAVTIGFVGVILILKPGEVQITFVAVLPVIAGLCYALSAIATRQWCEGETTLTLLLGLFASLGIWGLIGLTFFSLYQVPPDIAAQIPFLTNGWVAPSGTFTSWLIVQALGSLAAVALLTKGYQLGEASFLVVFEYAFLISAAFWSYALWEEIPDFRSMIGILAIVTSGLIIAARSR